MRFLILLIFLVPFSLKAQMTGKVTLDHLGIEFTIPEGWLGQPTDMGFILGSNTEPGAIFLMGHDARSLEALKQQAMQGIHEGSTQLMPQGNLQVISATSIGGVFAGVLEGQPVRAYGVGVVNPHGKGVSVLAVTTPALFSSRYETLATTIAKSLKFSEAKTSPVINEWKSALMNSRLTYMDSYQSGGGSYDGYSTGGGMSTKTVIDLCATGRFQYNHSSSVNVDTGGAFGGSNSGGGGVGNWEVVADVSGNAVLELKFNNGEVREYKLQYVDSKTLLNGVRYFRTNDAACN
jgi:hypothetical protein